MLTASFLVGLQFSLKGRSLLAGTLNLSLWIRLTGSYRPASVFGDIIAYINLYLWIYDGVSSLILLISTASLAKHLKEKLALGLPVFLLNTCFDNNQKCNASTQQFADFSVSQS